MPGPRSSTDDAQLLWAGVEIEFEPDPAAGGVPERVAHDLGDGGRDPRPLLHVELEQGSDMRRASPGSDDVFVAVESE